jgi:hypothetical protein
MQVLLLVLMVYAGVGLILSLTVHLLSFFSLAPESNTLFMAIHVGIFPMWFAVVMIMQKASGNSWIGGGASRKGIWKLALSGCPPWMRFMTYGFFVYAIINFVIFALFGLGQPHGHVAGGVPPSSVWHGFSGHWMAFYSAGLAVSVSVYNRGIDNFMRRCPNGHPVGLNDTFCATCGAKLDRQSAPITGVFN